MSLNLRCLILLLLPPLAAMGMPEDIHQKIHIASNAYEFNYKTGKDCYEGNVEIDQGSTHLKADRLVTQKNTQHKIISAIAYGLDKLAEYTTTPKQGDLVLNAKAKVIKYYPETSTIILEEQVTVIQGENSFHGAYIVYNMKNQTVFAPASKNGRATIVIEPNKVTHE